MDYYQPEEEVTEMPVCPYCNQEMNTASILTPTSPGQYAYIDVWICGCDELPN